MLKLTNIVKNYDSGAHEVHALKGINITFRKSEFVAILGHSGCGKTTMLNIIGGLDQYTSGDLIIRGKSTKNFKSRDWDTYRNHSVGFVFQSYNLIPHQSILANVELALTLSGVRKVERRRRATEALEKVGLADQLHKKPNQLSGGQMQRVAIARALVNDPEILLADEPTGALDSDTSVQVMDLLQEIAKDRLVIMVTHNPELAEQYANRIVRLVDGNILTDSNPYDGAEAEIEPAGKQRRASMSALTAFSLSLSNLMTKKGRTILTAFAGSIGIIGIAMILSLSTGINEYIAKVERDTLSSYPLTLEQSTIDMSALMDAMRPTDEDLPMEDGKIYSSNIMSSMMDMMLDASSTNNLKDFKSFLESGTSGIEDYVSEIRYGYSTPLNLYKADTSNGIFQVNPNKIFEELGIDMGNNPMMTTNLDVWAHLTTNQKLLETQYEVIAGDMPKAWNEVVLIVDENNRVTDFTLYALGILDISELKQAIESTMKGEEYQIQTEAYEFVYEDFLGMEFKILLSTDYYKEQNGKWVDMSEDDLYLTSKLAAAQSVRIVGILRPNEGVTGVDAGVMGYTGALMTHLINQVNNSEIVRVQRANPTVDIFTGLPFADPNEKAPVYTMDQLMTEVLPTLSQQDQMTMMMGIEMMRLQYPEMTDDQIAAYFSQMMAGSTATLKGNLELLGVSDFSDPAKIELFPVDFEAKDKIAEIIRNYNSSRAEEDQIVYTDYVGLMMSSITSIINGISVILIAFVGISLVVSSIMIGIITNISVLERTKEIGILRAVGASKRDVGRVFNAETMIVGLCAGLVGIGITELLLIPTNLIIKNLTDLDARAVLSTSAGIALVLISVFLTFVAGLIPSRKAAKKDPVVALRTE